MTDKLQELFTMQRELQENAYGYKFSTLTDEETTAFIKEMSIHTIQEINEMLYELPHFKPWKDYSKMTDEEKSTALAKARVEYVDTVHFMLNMGIALGFDGDMLHKAYMEKNEENYKRQQEGYTHDKTYRA